MFCASCGKQLEDNAKFCGGCGASTDPNADKKSIFTKYINRTEESEEKNLSSEFPYQSTEEPVPPTPSSPVPSMPATPIPPMPEKNKYSDTLIDPDEEVLGTLGNGYFVNLFYKKVKSCNAILTDKRVYLQGTLYRDSPTGLKQEIKEQIVDLEDITGTGFIYSNPFGILLALFWVILPWLLAFGYSIFTGIDPEQFYVALVADLIIIIITVLIYFLSRTVYFYIEYAGGLGFIYVDATVVGVADVKEFNKQIRRAKDKRKGKI